MTTHPTDNAPVHDLLPCPFCGSAPYSDEDDSHSTAWEIKCSCGAAPYVWEITKAEALTAWNTRTAPDLAAAMQPAAAEVEQTLLEEYVNACTCLQDRIASRDKTISTQAAEVARLRVVNAGLVEALEHSCAFIEKYFNPTAVLKYNTSALRNIIASATADQRGPVLDARGVA